MQSHNYLVGLGVSIRAQQVTIPNTARFSDEDLDRLREINPFWGLDCRCTTLTSDGIVAYLAQADGLQRVRWEGPPVTDDVIAAMGRLQSLTQLHLQGTFRGTGLWALAQGPVRRSLQRLTLQTDFVEHSDGGIWLPQGLKAEAFGAIGNLPELRGLRLLSCGVSDERLESLSRLKNLKELELDGNPIRGSGLMWLDGLPELEVLSLNFCRLADHELTGFPRLPALRVLHLSGNQLGDAGLAIIGVADLPNLASLYISRTDITDAGLKALLPLKNLEDLNLTETRVDGTGLPALRSLPIRSFRLSRTPLDPGTLGSLADFPHLRALDISGTRLTDDDLPVLDSLSHLVYLNVTRTRVSAEALDRLRRERAGCRIEQQEDRVFERWLPILPGGHRAAD